MGNRHSMRGKTYRWFLTSLMVVFMVLSGIAAPISNMGIGAVYAATNVDSWTELKTAIERGESEINLTGSFPYDGKGVEIVNNVTITGTGTIYLDDATSYDSMFTVKSGGSLTIDQGVTLSGQKTAQGCDGDAFKITKSMFDADGYAGSSSTYKPKGFFIDVANDGSATLNGRITNFITSREKADTPRYVAPVVANGDGATFNIGASGVINNNVVGYIVDDDMAYTNAQTIKQYVKGAPPNSLRVPGAATQKANPEKYERTRNKNAGIDGNSDEDLGSGITATAGAVIYKDGAKGEVLGTVANNRGDTGGIMASGENTQVDIKGETSIERNVGVQFGGGSTTENGAMIAMHSGTMEQNVAWFGGGAVYATENGVDWLLGKIVEADGKPDFDARKDGHFAMAGGSLTGNTAFTRGGAILVDSDGVVVTAGKLKDNMSWMLGGAVYVMGDHPKYTYTMHLDPVYVHDNTAVSGYQSARDQAASSPSASPSAKTLDELNSANALLQRKLSAPSDSCDDINDLFSAGTISTNTDDNLDGQGNDGTGGGVWLCPYGSVVFDAEKTGNVVIKDNYATGTKKGILRYNNDDENYNSNESDKSHSGISGGSDFHADEAKNSGGVTITGLVDGNNNPVGWINENTDGDYTTEITGSRVNLVNTAEIGQDDVPKKYRDDEYVEITGNISRRGGGLASDGKFYFGPAPSIANINAKMTVSKEWTAAAKTEPIAIRVLVKKGDIEHVVADVPLDGISNGPVSEFDTVSELKPVGNLWTGEFSFPLIVTDAEGNNPIQLYELYHNNQLIDMTKALGREKLGELVKNNQQDDVKVKAASDVTISYKEMNVKRDNNGNWTATTEHTSHVFTPNNIDFSNLKFKVEEKEEYKEDYIDPETGEIKEKTAFGIYTLGLALQLESGNDNEPIVEKYVNKDVHSDIVNFDQVFTYDVMAYVPYKATEIVIEDELVPGLEFADKNGRPVSDASTIESITVKPSNNHEPEGTVSETGMKNPADPKYTFELKNSGHTSIDIQDNKLSVTIKNIQGSSSGYASHPSTLRGRWVQLTFYARIKDEYRNLEDLKALQNSWKNESVNKQGSNPHDVSFENPDNVLIKPVLDAKKDAIIWAAEGPSRLFARTASGEYYSTENKNGESWQKVESGTDLWNNADRRYRGQASDTVRELDIENADYDLIKALEDLDEIKRYEAVRGAEGGTRLFVEIKPISGEGSEVYATPNSDNKQGHTWEKLSPGTGDYNNAVNVMNGASNTIRKFDFEAESFTLKGDGKNWPVVTEKGHEGMSNSAGYEVKFGNNASGKIKSNIVTVKPETTEIDIIKKWAPDNKWPEDIKSVKFNIYSKKEGVEKQVYVDNDGKVIGAFADGDANIPSDAEPLTVELIKDDPTTDADESKATIEGLPKLIGTIYLARETEITYLDGETKTSVDVNYIDDAKKNGVTEVGDNTVFTSTKTTYKGDGAKLKKLASLGPVRGAIADNRLWAIVLNGDYYFTEVGDVDGTSDGTTWKKIEKPDDDADPASAEVKNYKRAKELLGTVSEKPETVSGTTQFDVTRIFNTTNSTSDIEKYVNNDVHADIGEFDKAFKYDIMVYVPEGSTKLTINDGLRESLEFANKMNSLDDAERSAAVKAENAESTIARVAVKADNNHYAASVANDKHTVDDSDKDVNPVIKELVYDEDYKADIADNRLTVTFEGESDPVNPDVKKPLSFAGNWVQLTFWAKYTDAIISAAQAGDIEKIRENGAVISEKYPDVSEDASEDTYSHEGTINNAAASFSIGNDHQFDIESNKVTVTPDIEKVWVQKKLVDRDGVTEISWPEGMTFDIAIKRTIGENEEVVQTITADSADKFESNSFPKMIGATYSAEEVNIPQDYTQVGKVTGSGTEEDPFVVTNKDARIDIEVTKTWSNVTMDEIPSAEDFKTMLILKNSDDEDVSEQHRNKLKVTVNGRTFNAKWSFLPNDEYTVDEKEIPGFETSIDTSTDPVSITNTKKPEEEKPEIEKYVNKAVHKDILLSEVFTYDIIAYITKDADSVTITDTLNDVLSFNSSAEDVKVVDLGENNNHKVTNDISSVLVNDDATVAEEGLAVDDAQVTIDGQTLKVFMTNNLKKATESYNVVEIQSINPNAKGYYEKDGDEYIATEDTVADPAKSYYEKGEDSYTKAAVSEGDSVDGLFVKDGDEYVPAVGTADSDTTYYEKVGSYSEVSISYINPSDNGYYEKNGNKYELTSDTAPDPGKTYYVKSDVDEDSAGYEYDGDDQPVTALRGHWIKVTFDAKIKSGKTLADVKKAFADISSEQAEEDRAEDNVGNAPVISTEDHSGVPNNSGYSIGVANEAGIVEDTYKDKSNTVTVKPLDEKPEIEKYVNEAVHKDILIDEEFEYDIIAYITKDAETTTIKDELDKQLQFVSNPEDVKVEDLGTFNNHKVTNDISAVKVNEDASVADPGTVIEKSEVSIDKDKRTLTVKLTDCAGVTSDQNLRGHWVRVSFKCKIKDGLKVSNLKYTEIKDADEENRDAPNVGNDPVISDEDHKGVPNKASYEIDVKNSAGKLEVGHKDESNTVTVKPDKTPVYFIKKELGGDELEGAEFIIKDEKGNVIEEWISTTESHRIDLKPGKYSMQEVVAPEGFQRVTTTIWFEVNENGKISLITAEVDNEGKISIMDADHIILEDAPVRNPILSISKTSKTKNAMPGDVIDYAITIENSGDGDAEAVEVVDTMDNNLTYVSDNSNGVNDGQKVTWIVDVAAGKTKTIKIKCRVDEDAAGKVINKAEITNYETEFVDNGDDEHDVVLGKYKNKDSGSNSKSKTRGARTGDETQIVLWSITLLLTLALVVVLKIRRRYQR